MSDELHTYIEPELEARITALVLGEASEFEVDELERLIKESPELAVFQRRMKVMHGLLGGAVKPESDEAWKLSEDRRAVLQKIFSSKAESLSKNSPRRKAVSQWQGAIAIAACVMVCFILFMMATPSSERVVKESFTSDIVSYQAAEEDESHWGYAGKIEQNFDRTVDSKALPLPLIKKFNSRESKQAKVIASNGTSYSAIELPDVSVADAQVDSENIDDFGDGWGEADLFGSVAESQNKTQDRVIRRELFAKSEKESGVKSGTTLYWDDNVQGVKSGGYAGGYTYSGVASNRSRLAGQVTIDDLESENVLEGKDHFKEDSSVEVIREFIYPTEYESHDLPNQLAGGAGEEPFDSSIFPMTPATPGVITDERRNSIDASDALAKLKRGSSSIAKQEIFRRSDLVGEADKAPIKGRESYEKKDVKEASKQYKLASRFAIPTKPGVSGKGSKFNELEVELKNKNDRVAELRERLMDVAEKTGLIYVETEAGGKTIGDITGLRKVAEKELYDAEGSERQLKSQINKLFSVNDDDLISAVSALPDVGFKEAHNKYEDAKSELQTMKASGLAENHPNLVMRKKRITEMEKRLKKRAVNVRKSLKHNLGLMQGRVANMRSVVNREQDEGLDAARSMQELNVARKEYEMARGIRDGIEAQYDLEKTKLSMPSSADELKPARRPTVTIPSPITSKALPDEITTLAIPFSTFSLNVSDVSFKLAKVALLENGKWPDAAKIRTEEFVNAFDYGDPSPRRGEPVACNVDQSTHPFLQQRNLLRIGMKTAAVGRSAPLRLTVLLDNSGSMEREDREASVLAAIQVLADQLGPQDVITLVGFASQPRLLADRLSGDKAGKLVNIVANTPSEGGTNLEEALRLARTLAMRQHSDGAQDRVVLITDGVANLGNTVPEELTKQIEVMRQQGIAFDACGVGAEGLNDDILESLTRKGDGRYYFLNRAEDADSGFAKQLAGALSPAAKNVKVQVKFNPKRVSKYRLLGFEKHRLKKEDFRNDKVDAAEMAAEEAGNAVYQIQVNPNGEGEVGEVFVRFLDTNTGQMVERSWPLLYEPKAKSFDLAAPSMQLAGTAALLGEKLHGTDAGSVRFPMISNTLGKLRGHYSADRKVQDLIRMCEKVK